MSYTLAEWTTFCETALGRLNVIELPVTTEARIKAIPGSKAHCTIANAFAAFTSMDPTQHHIEVTAEYIKFVLNNLRYFLIHEVVGAEHIKQLDSLGTNENTPEAAAAFEPFILKLRAHAKRNIRVYVEKPIMATKKKSEGDTKPKSDVVMSIEKSKVNDDKIPAAAVINARRSRKDISVRKSRWAL